MTSLMIKDLTTHTDLDLDHSAMASVRGGLTAVINNSQIANQVVTGGNGPVFAINSPVSAPSTVLTESNPFTMVNTDTINLLNSFQNAIAA
ncbi:MAG TPA: hypothetical protein ENJ84_05445 [Gammaproteobacteria bacterium]|nr:hypothetical protein [Gammaproteobacteria bacterium]